MVDRRPPYSVQVKPAAQRALRKLDAASRRRISVTIDRLESDPRPPGAKALVGLAGLWRVRVGDYRIIYTINDAILTVLVVTIGHRRDVYRGL